MSDQSKKYALNGSQRLAAEILATNDVHKMTLAQIAQEAGVSDRTLYRWKQDPDFIAYQNEVAELTMKDFLAEAYNNLKDIVRASGSEKNRLKAIELVLKNQGRLTEVQKIEAKVEDSRSNDAIEAEIDNLKKLLAEM
ncbi:TetR family transcriptional regulator [Heliobacterium undosum]|uniref:TetR family transcriptional regulator n=1 Tax=Heliomicrobium undosum TaxID=121734 RepID=A0A845L1N0_9FIRM|nr:phBC6A51 family helix-turn-helix protein [Heliomicrobium undosum]MZP28704.1 TetR family transcriptional regulator [Heliomicrobium undosum]